MPDASAPDERGRYFVDNNHFVKEFSSDVDVEFEKATRMFDISRGSALFDAPKALFLGPGETQVTYELMAEDVLSIRDLFIRYLSAKSGAEVAKHLFRKLGQSLAVIHRELNLRTASVWTLPDNMRAERGADEFADLVDQAHQAHAVFLHCDFGFSNIFVKKGKSQTRDDPELWIIDPSPNYFMTFSTNLKGPPEIDIANLVSCMHGLFPLRKQVDCDWTASFDLFEKLINGYERESSYSVDQVLLKRAVEFTLKSYMKKRVRNSVMRRIALLMLCSERRTAGLYRG